MVFAQCPVKGGTRRDTRLARAVFVRFCQDTNTRVTPGPTVVTCYPLIRAYQLQVTKSALELECAENYGHDRAVLSQKFIGASPAYRGSSSNKEAPRYPMKRIHSGWSLSISLTFRPTCLPMMIQYYGKNTHAYVATHPSTWHLTGKYGPRGREPSAGSP